MPTPPEQKPADTGTATAESERSIRAAVELKLGGTAERRPAPPVIPDHTLLRRIGRGAYGEVWLARSALGTLRAVKIVHRSDFEDEHPYEREFRGILKYEPISRTHEGLVQVLHVGRNDDAGCFYYVMELADGAGEQVGKWESEKVGNKFAAPLSLSHSPTFSPASYTPCTLRSELKQRQRLAPADAAQLTLRLASALAHLHAQGLVHRDIKPGNVIFVNGQPKLADIGLVAGAGDSRSFVGTEGFIPPEGPGSVQADIYSLGKLLYELATGRDRLDFPQLPPLGASASSRRVHDQKEVRTGKMTALLGDDEALLELNEVMTRACAPDLQQRYASATEMQAELNLFLAGRSLRHTRNVELNLARLKKFAVAACVFLVLAAVALWLSKREERHARERADAEAALRLRAESAEHQTQQQLYTALLEQARATVRSAEMGHRVRALEAARRVAAISNSVELRSAAFAALVLPDLRFERELPTDSDVTLALMNPAFDRIALCRSNGLVEIRAATNLSLLSALASGSGLPIREARWSPDGEFFALRRDRDLFGQRADVEVWRANGEKALSVSNTTWGSMAFHPRRARLMTGDTTAALLWDLEGGGQLERFPVPGEVMRLQFAPDGERFVSICRSNRGCVFTVHETSTGEPGISHSFPTYVGNIDWHPDGTWIALPESNAGGAVRLVDSRNGNWRIIGQHKAEAVTAAFSPDGGYLISGGFDRELICWDLQSMQRALTIGLSSYRAAFSRDGRRCAVATDTGVQVHLFEQPFQRNISEDIGVRMRWGAFSPDSRWLAVSGAARLGVWDLAVNGTGHLSAMGADSRVYFSAGGELITDQRNVCLRWRVAPGKPETGPPRLEPLTFPASDAGTTMCVWSNEIVFTGASGTRTHALDETATETSAWLPTARGLNSVSPDGRWLAVIQAYSQMVHVYHRPGLTKVATITTRGMPAAVNWSPAGDEMTTDSQGGVEFWSTTDWRRTRAVSNMTRVLFAPDARTCWLSRDFREAALCDVRTLEPLLRLPTGMVPLAQSPDGKHLAVSVEGRRLQVWDLAEVHRQLQELGLAVKSEPK